MNSNTLKSPGLGNPTNAQVPAPQSLPNSTLVPSNPNPVFPSQSKPRPANYALNPVDA